jgi:hypothetical protein
VFTLTSSLGKLQRRHKSIKAMAIIQVACFAGSAAGVQTLHGEWLPTCRYCARHILVYMERGFLFIIRTRVQLTNRAVLSKQHMPANNFHARHARLHEMILPV